MLHWVLCEINCTLPLPFPPYVALKQPRPIRMQSAGSWFSLRRPRWENICQLMSYCNLGIHYKNCNNEFSILSLQISLFVQSKSIICCPNWLIVISIDYEVKKKKFPAIRDKIRTPNHYTPSRAISALGWRETFTSRYLINYSMDSQTKNGYLFKIFSWFFFSWFH